MVNPILEALGAAAEAVNVELGRPGKAIIDILEAPQRAAYSFLLSGVEQGLSANKILSSLREAGMGIRREDGLQIINLLKGNVTKSAYIKSVNLNKLPNPDRFGLSATVINGRYSYLVRIEGTHSITGENLTQFISVATDEVLTKQAALDIAVGFAQANPENYNIEIDRTVVDNAFRNPLFG